MYPTLPLSSDLENRVTSINPILLDIGIPKFGLWTHLGVTEFSIYTYSLAVTVTLISGLSFR